MNILVQVFLQKCFSFIVMITFKIDCRTASHQQCVSVSCSTSPLTSDIISLSNFCHSRGCEVVSCNFVCISLVYHFIYLLVICILVGLWLSMRSVLVMIPNMLRRMSVLPWLGIVLCKCQWGQVGWQWFKSSTSLQIFFFFSQFMLSIADKVE